ncbi:MalY/PatB family protein [Devriesea agamarum]|uniref:MalY/PatB family protein n=1 Tax=Devriesea agamarum TaxID=472569 RepID=UPI00071D61D5|nr:aminotransferase class I/II-fold pyridoxal phosphate-dependent enzyme [Devriesea agamarum]
MPSHSPHPAFDSFDSLSIADLRARGCMKWTQYPEDVLALWVAESDVPTAAPVCAAIQDTVRREGFGYASPRAKDELRAACSTWVSHVFDVSLDPSHVHPLPDVMQGVVRGIELFFDPGPVILPTPCYPPFRHALDVLGRQAIEVPLIPDPSAITASHGDAEPTRWVLDLERIEEALAHGARGVLLCSPHNPLGTVFRLDEHIALAHIVQRHGARVLSDEIHAPMFYDRVHIPYASSCPEAKEHTVTVSSPSKTWNLAGLHAAMMVTSQASDRDRWLKMPSTFTGSPTTIGTAAATAALLHGEPWRIEFLRFLRRNRDHLSARLAQELPEVTYTHPEGTYLAWLDFSETRIRTNAAASILREGKVALSPGTDFAPSAAAAARLNFATTHDILDAAINRIRDVIHPA